jgi:hypothetical protein
VIHQLNYKKCLLQIDNAQECFLEIENAQVCCLLGLFQEINVVTTNLKIKVDEVNSISFLNRTLIFYF